MISAIQVWSAPLQRCILSAADFIPSPNHAGGLALSRYELDPFTALCMTDLWRQVSVPQTSVFEARCEQFARVEGILPAPESSHAIKKAIDEALKCKETGEKTILFGLTGTGYFDMVAYEKFHDGKMDDYIPTDAELEESFRKAPPIR